MGSHLCAALHQHGDDVVALDDLSNGRAKNVPEGVRLVQRDLSEKHFAADLKGWRPDVVLHCAAQSSNALSFKNPSRDLQVNQYGALNLLEWCCEQGVPRFIFTSSMSVYGQAARLPTPEIEPCLPDSFYAVHKLASEHYVRIFAQEHGLATTVFRLYTTYGQGQNLENRDQGLISIYLSYILRGERLLVRGAKDRRRDIIHVKDVTKAIVDSIDRPATYGKIYNLGTGRWLTVSEIVSLLISLACHDPGTYPVEWGSATAGDPHATLADIQRLIADLGWRPAISAEEGLKETVASHRRGL